jgi:hypothetical protein
MKLPLSYRIYPLDFLEEWQGGKNEENGVDTRDAFQLAWTGLPKRERIGRLAREIEAEAERGEGTPPAEEIPYGMRIASDCHHLEENPSEMQILKFLAELIVQDASFNAMADALNTRGFRTRDARAWTAAGVFKLTPRLIEIAPRILSGQEWESRKKQLSRVTWNS